jgi:hypothetical protein
MWAIHLEGAMGASQTVLPFKLAASDESGGFRERRAYSEAGDARANLGRLSTSGSDRLELALLRRRYETAGRVRVAHRFQTGSALLARGWTRAALWRKQCAPFGNGGLDRAALARR